MPLNRPPLFQPLRFVVPQAPDKSRAERIAEIAYSYAQNRGFAAGHEVEDWLAAEAEVDRLGAGGLSGEPLP